MISNFSESEYLVLPNEQRLQFAFLSHHSVVSIFGTKMCCSILSQIKPSEIYYRNDLFHVGWFIHRKIFLLRGKAKEEKSLNN